MEIGVRTFARFDRCWAGFGRFWAGLGPEVERSRPVSRPGNGHETALQLVSGADFSCVLHHFSSLTRRSESRGQGRPENDQNGRNLNYSF